MGRNGLVVNAAPEGFYLVTFRGRLFDKGQNVGYTKVMKLLRDLFAAIVVALWITGCCIGRWLTEPPQREPRKLYTGNNWMPTTYRYKSDLEIDYALLWSFHQSRLDGQTRFVYDSVKGVAVSMHRVPEGKNYFTDGKVIGLWPAGWDEGFREREIESRVLNGPELQFT